MRAFIFLSAFLMALPAMAQDISVSGAYSFATAESQKNGAAFMVIENAGEADRLVSAAGDVAVVIELHTHTHEDGVMKMRKVDGFDIPAGQTVLEPMGHHIMLMGLGAPLEAGTSFPLTLHFEKAGEMTVDVQVMPPGEKPE